MAANNKIQVDPTNADLEKDPSDEEIKSLIWWRVHWSRVCLFYLLSLLSLGSLLVVCYWFPRIKSYVIGSRCHKGRATHALIRDIDNNWNIVEIRTETLGKPCSFNNINSPEEDESARLILEENVLFTFLLFRQARYVVVDDGEGVRKQTAFDESYFCEEIYEKTLGEAKNAADSLKIYGPNLIDVPVKSYWRLFIEEVIDPFYLFQLFSIVIWLMVNYYYYAGAVFIISAVSISLSLYQTRKNMVQLKNMIAFSCRATVHRGTAIHTNIHSIELYPGDVIEIPPNGFTVPCDCVLLSGNAIVNESMLTGESVPVFKTALPHNNDEIYNVKIHKRHTLFNGTQVIQTRNVPDAKVLAFVVRTGYSTSKGELVRSIIYPKPTHLRFFRQSLKFLLFLILLGLVGMAYTLVIELVNQEIPFSIFLHMADLFTTAVPPSLPAAMTVGVIYALARLKKQKIFCISPQRINVSGKVKCICFDKTGTLTEDGLDFWGVVPVLDGRFTEHVQDLSKLGVTPLTIAMSCCHSLTLIDGQLVGDPVDLNMFNATGFSLEEPREETNRFDLLVPALVRSPDGAGLMVEVGILHQYPFSSELQRMSVIAKCLGETQQDNLILYCKGSPEMISSLSLPHSLPDNFNQVLSVYTNMGLRVLALAYKDLAMPWHKVGRVPRQEMEKELTFLGLLLMQNKLKPQTTAVVRDLNRVDIRNVMVTGDNLLTALNVACECEIIQHDYEVFIVSFPNCLPTDTTATMDHAIKFTPQNSERILRPITHANPLSTLPKSKYCFAMDGTTFQLIRDHTSKYILTALMLKCAVFARMSPTQKSIVVEELQKLGYVVAMCGDGANDCGALKTADVGVSLSDSEASVASHFTSKVHDIRCVPIVVKEGRTALVTSFSIFKFMALYCVIEFTSVVLLYWWLSNLGDWQYLYIDLIQVFALALVMGYTKSFPRLAYRRPSANLVNPINLISCGVHMLLAIGFQISSYLLLINTRWYVPVPISPVKDPFAPDKIVGFENTIIFTFSTFQYLIMAFVFSIGPPYRKPFFTNIYFLICFILLTCISLLFTFQPGRDVIVLHQIYVFMQLIYIYSWTFLLGLVLFAGVHLLVSLIVEEFVIRTEWFRVVVHFFLCKTRQKNLYKRLLTAWSHGAEEIREAIAKMD